MALPTWVWIFILVFHWLVGPLITAVSSWFWYMRGSGKLGGGRQVWDFKAYEQTGVIGRDRRVQSYKGMFFVDKGGDETALLENAGLFGTRWVSVKKTDLLYDNNPENPVVIGVKGLEAFIGRAINSQMETIVLLRNRLSALTNELADKDHNISKIIDENNKLLNDTAKAVIGMYKTRSGSKKK